MRKLSHWANIDIIAEMREHSRADAPLSPIDTLLGKLLCAAIERTLRRFGVNNFVEAREDIAACYMLKRGA